MILCKKCGSDNVHKNGTKEIKKEKRQVWKCKDCKHKFNTDFQEIELSGGKFKEYSKEELTENALYLETAVRNVRTIEDLIAFHDIDMNVWKIEKQVVNFWGKEGNRQVKGWFKKRDKSDIDFDKALEDFKEKASKYSPKVKKIKYKKEKNAKMLELGPVDHHLAQLSWDKETGFGDYDINIAKKLYLDAVEYLLQQSSFMYNIDEIMFTIGSDFYNSDTIDNTTTKGTIQSEDSRYQKSFDVGCDTIIEALNMCKQVAPVKGFVIQGNHDRQKTYYMGKVIEAWFRNDENIEIDTRPRLRKYHKYGKNLIGLSHEGKDDSKLAQLMPLEAPQEWADTKYREWHKGHVHHESKKFTMFDSEVSGIKIKTLSALVALDAWHSEKGYHSMRQSQGFIWDKEKGNIAEFKYTV